MTTNEHITIAGNEETQLKCCQYNVAIHSDFKFIQGCCIYRSDINKRYGAGALVIPSKVIYDAVGLVTP